MVVKVYISGMSGNKEVKKRQQRVLMILDSKSIKYDIIDITEPGKETEKEMMQEKSTHKGGTVSDPNPRHALPPQLFYDDEYCGDYDEFDLANEIDKLEVFLKMAPEEIESVSTAQIELSTAKKENGDADENKENDSENKEEAKSTNGHTAEDTALTDSEKLIQSEQDAA
ncbi:SH3 domain-binding glutamic acid-rich protein homolog isoform X3 [Bradysia coprophila]|uniref:SH3 domain-binding glutamic acid-rich protein homolog isoform X3 n=1 Tax=Bradysia coprophila TaxID=38358 RepID=UPI00187DA4D1|nr:SH3 domain-binding glutamic acid-rich protein homolog isoform X3 [Bradysia coprophila]